MMRRVSLGERLVMPQTLPHMAPLAVKKRPTGRSSSGSANTLLATCASASSMAALVASSAFWQRRTTEGSSLMPSVTTSRSLTLGMVREVLQEGVCADGASSRGGDGLSVLANDDERGNAPDFEALGELVLLLPLVKGQCEPWHLCKVLVERGLVSVRAGKDDLKVLAGVLQRLVPFDELRRESAARAAPVRAKVDAVGFALDLGVELVSQKLRHGARNPGICVEGLAQRCGHWCCSSFPRHRGGRVSGCR